jgi:hypothetical protein
MRAKLILENTFIKKRMDPKIPMRLGSSSKSFHVIDIEREVTEEEDGLVRDYNEDISEDEILDLFNNWSKYDHSYFTGLIFYVLAPDLDPKEYDGDEEIFLAHDLNNKWIDYNGNHYYLSNDNLNESINFERTGDVKRGAKIGHSHLFPEKDLFMRIHSFCKDGVGEYFKYTSEINWDKEEPVFESIIDYEDGPNNENYTFYLTTEGVIAFHNFFDYGGNYKEIEHLISDFNFFLSMIRANHSSR